MRVLLTKEYINQFDLKQLTKAIFKLFDDYNYKVNLAQYYLTSSLDHELYDRPESFQNGRKSDPVTEATIKREKLLSYIKEFENKLKYLKLSLTDDELKILIYSVGERETDKEVSDRLARSYKTFYVIKKSCYVKIALRFGLVNEIEKTILQTISLYD